MTIILTLGDLRKVLEPFDDSVDLVIADEDGNLLCPRAELNVLPALTDPSHFVSSTGRETKRIILKPNDEPTLGWHAGVTTQL